MQNFNWKCPYCNHLQAVTENQYSKSSDIIYNHQSKYGNIGYYIQTIRCANKECLELQLEFFLVTAKRPGNHLPLSATNEVIQHWRLLPESIAKPQPTYIPEAIVKNYTEACRICELSPNASTTMSRRCLQGMIRDFCDISKDSLFKEIEELRKRVENGNDLKHVNVDTIDAIDHVRQMGNIGAHMEKDVNLIIDVEPHEANALIGLIELLFDEWYIQRESRKTKLQVLQNIGINKQEKRNTGGKQ